MPIDCYCDGEPASVYSSKSVTARKPHRCEECSRTIRIGERYKYEFGIWDGYPMSIHTCSHCVEIRRFMTVNIPCFCWNYGELISQARETIQEAYRVAPDEVRGLAAGFLRRVVAGQRARRAMAESEAA